MSEPSENSLKLIESIYRAALDPRGYDIFMGHWDDWMSARMVALDGLRQRDPAMSAPEVAAHFELALRLLERLGDTPAGAPPRGPQILVDGADRLLAETHRLGADECAICALLTEGQAAAAIAARHGHRRTDAGPAAAVPVADDQPASERAFAARHGERITLDVVEDAGQLVFFRAPGRVPGVVAEMSG